MCFTYVTIIKYGINIVKSFVRFRKKKKKKTFDTNHFQIFDFFSKIIIKIDNL